MQSAGKPTEWERALALRNHLPVGSLVSSFTVALRQASQSVIKLSNYARFAGAAFCHPVSVYRVHRLIAVVV